MKQSLRLVIKLFTCILAVGLSANLAQATVTYWDPEGARFAYTVYTGGVLNGVWENSSWTTNDKGAAGVAFTEGNAACFAVGAGASNNTAASTTIFSVVMNANHTIAGIFDGTLNPGAGKVTISGTGILTLTNGLDAFSVGTNGFGVLNNNSVGMVTVGVPMTGPGTMVNEGNGGTLFLTASNSYSGGTILGFTNLPINGTITFNNSSAFGTGPIVVSNGLATISCTNAVAGVIVTNPVDFSQAAPNPALNFIGTAAGVIWSGDMNMGGNNANVGSAGAAATQVILSNNIIGTAGFTKTGGGTLTLLGAPSYSGGTTITAGTLQIGNGGSFGAHGSGSISIAAGATLTYNKTGTVTENEAISNQGNVTQAGSGTLILNNNNSYSGQTTISAGTLQLAAANNIGPLSPVKVSSIFDLNGIAATINALFGQGNVINNNLSLTVNGNNTTGGGVYTTYSPYSGVISGSGSLFKQGSAAMSLRGINTFSGGSAQIEGGTLSLGAGPDRLPSGTTLVVFGGAQFQLDGENQTVSGLSGGGNVNLGGGTLTVNQGSGTTFSGSIQNTEIGSTNSTATGNGLRGYYYDNLDFTTLKAVRDDASVNFPALTSGTNANAMPGGGIATNTFSVRWVGQVLTTAAGTYNFITLCDDGSRLWVNGSLIVDNWVAQGPTPKTGSISLGASTLYDIVLEYFNDGGPGSAVLSWIPPGGSSNAIPSANLVLPGAGSLVKSGGGNLLLTGQNTYTGPTIVNGGTLELNASNCLGSANITVTNGGILKVDTNKALNPDAVLILNTNSPGTVNLNFSGQAFIGMLSLNGGSTFEPGGTWGSGSSGAIHTSSRFTGNGQLTVPVCSSTNRILSISNNLNNTLTLQIQGSQFARYYLVSTTNITQSITNWTAVRGSTNLGVSAPNGIWSATATNKAPAYFGVKALSPCN